MMYILFNIGLDFLTRPIVAHAAAPCLLLPTGCAAQNNALFAIDDIAQILIFTGAGLCVLYAMWGGAQMIISNGDESKISQGRMSIIYAMLGFAVVLISQTIVRFTIDRADRVLTNTASNILLRAIAELIDVMLYVFNTALVIVIMIAGFRFVIGRGESSAFEGARTMLIWAIVGGVLINLARTAAQIVLNLGL